MEKQTRQFQEHEARHTHIQMHAHALKPTHIRIYSTSPQHKHAHNNTCMNMICNSGADNSEGVLRKKGGR